jgi:hypothetical protein
MKSVSYENKIKSAIRGAQSVPMAMLTICGKTYPSNNKYVIFKNSTILFYICESDVNSEKIKKSVRVHIIKVPLHMQQQ